MHSGAASRSGMRLLVRIFSLSLVCPGQVNLLVSLFVHRLGKRIVVRWLARVYEAPEKGTQVTCVGRDGKGVREAGPTRGVVKLPEALSAGSLGPAHGES